MRRIILYIATLILVITTLSGCNFLIQNPDLEVALDNVITSTNYYAWFYSSIEYPHEREYGDYWTVKRDGDVYWIESSFDGLQLYRENHGDTYTQFTRYGKSADFSANSSVRYKDYLLDLSDLNSNWFEVDSSNKHLYHAKQKDLEAHFELGIESNWFELNDIDLSLISYTIELTDDLHIKQINYEIDSDDTFSLHTKITFLEYDTVSLGQPVGTKYPNVVDDINNWRIREYSQFNILQVQLDYEPFYEVQRYYDYFTIQMATSDVLIHNIKADSIEEFTSFTLDGQTVTSYLADQDFNFYPSFLLTRSYTDSDYEIVGEHPLQFRLKDEFADPLAAELRKPELYGVDDIPEKILNVIVELIDGKNVFKIDFDRVSENGIHHWSFRYDRVTSPTLDSQFTDSHFPLDIVFQMYPMQLIQRTTLKSSIIPGTSYVDYQMSQYGNRYDIHGSLYSDKSTTVLKKEPLLGKLLWMNEDGTLTYQPVNPHAELVTIPTDSFGFPFEIMYLSEWHTEWFVEDENAMVWTVKPEYQSDFLDVLGYDYNHYNRPTTIESFKLYYGGNTLGVKMIGTLPTGEQVTFQRTYDTGPN